MQDFRGVGWGTQRAQRVQGRVEDRRRPGRRAGPATPSIISNELLGGADAERIAAGLASVGPADMHVIFSARDFARQLVSDWQEHIKHKHEVTLEKFVDDLIELGLDAPKPFGELFWGMHDAAYVLRRWAVVVPAENIHVVTLPPPGRTQGHAVAALLRGSPVSTAGGYDAVTERANPSMGVAETELVRRMNAYVQGMPAENYDPLVRIQLAEHILGGQPPKLMLPTGRMDWVMERSRQLIDELKSAGYPVDRRPRRADAAACRPRGLRLPDRAHARPTSGRPRSVPPPVCSSSRAGNVASSETCRTRSTASSHPGRRSARDRGVEVYWQIRGRVGRAAPQARPLRRR